MIKIIIYLIFHQYFGYFETSSKTKMGVNEMFEATFDICA